MAFLFLQGSSFLFSFLSSSLFFEKPKRQNPLHNRENHVTSYDESHPPSLRDISYDHSANNLYLRTPIYFLILAFPYTRPRCGVPFIVTSSFSGIVINEFKDSI